MNRRTRTLLGAMLLAAVSLPVAGAVPAVAQEAPVLGLTLVSQDVTVVPDTDTTIVFHPTSPIPADATIVVQAYNRVETRGDVRNAIDNGVKGNVVSGGRVEYDPTQLVAVDDDLSLTIGVQTGRTDRTRLRLANPGLYPITLQVLLDDEPIGSMLTFIERAGDTTPEPNVRVAIAVDVDSLPTLQADGTTEVPDSARDQIDRLVELLESTSVPITIAVRPELLEGLADSGEPSDTARLDRLTAALADRTILPDTFVPLSPSSSAATDFGTEFRTQLLLGEDAISDVLDITPARRTWWVREPLDAAGLSLLRDLGFPQLLLSGDVRDDLPRRDGELGTPEAAGTGTMPTLLADLVVQARLTRPTADPVLVAHDIVADLVAMSIENETLATERDEATVPRGLLVDVSDLDDTGRAIFANVVGLLEGTTRITIEDADEIISELAADTPPARLDRFRMNFEKVGQEAIDTAADVVRLRTAIDTTSSMLPSGSAAPDGWKALVSVLPADNLTSDERETYVRQLDGELGEVRGCVSVRTSGQVSLGGRVSKVPLTLLNDCDFDVKIRTRLTSPKLVLSEPDTVTELTAGERYQFEIPVEARTNGLFEVEVQLLTPGGDPPDPLDRPVSFKVRASALTGLGQVVSGALLLVLLTWWVQHGLKRRRLARASAAELAAPSHPSASGSASAPTDDTTPTPAPVEAG